MYCEKAVPQCKLHHFKMPPYDETSVEVMYPQLKNVDKFAKYWSDTPKDWKPTYEYFWNVIFLINLINLYI